MVALVGVAVVAVLAVVAVVVLTQDEEGTGDGGASDRDAAAAAITRFVEAVNRGAPGEGGTATPAEEVTAAYTAITEGLGNLSITATPGDVALAEAEATASAPLEVVWSVEGATWNTSGTVTAVFAGAEGQPGEWSVLWDIAALDNRLRPGDSLSAVATDSERGPILDAAGEALVAPTPVVIVGVEPGAVPDTQAVAGELARLVGVDGAALAARIDAAPDDQFVEVITLRRTDYDPIRDQLQALPGTRFREDTASLAPNRDFARPILGSVGPADEEDVAEGEGRVELGDLIGQSGVQARYDEQLTGTPGLEIRVNRAASTPPDGQTTTTDPNADPVPPAVETLETIPPGPGTPVKLTLDRAAQQAAEDALAGDDRLSALVAVRASTGEILAAATGPTGSAQNIAFNGQVAPGSTMKVITALAAIRRGRTPDSIVSCPAEINAGGQIIGNAGEEVLGDTSLLQNFSHSCNTAFIGLALEYGNDELHNTSLDFGLGAEWDPGLGAFTGSVPVNDGPASRGLSAIGQGTVQASPLAMAMVAATVAAGQWNPPHIVADPAPENPAPIPLDPTAAGYLRTMMRQVTIDGTAGGAFAGVEGEVFGKTGTSEFGSGEVLQTNAWFIGFRGDVAFCAFVEGGSAGASVAAPKLAAFLNAYNP
ncbi:MAG TPA: penicillin-binding transpeptidase domain-containing protein [Iamia sp.]